MNFGFSEEPIMLRDQVSRFMHESWPMSSVRELILLLMSAAVSIAVSVVMLTAAFSVYAAGAATNTAPMYKASSKSPAMDILSNSYGYSSNAPSALEIGHQAPDFSLP
ncbi:MAG: hypothetical protein GXP16_05800, partial [Gammaproteobacteria bacterium]|nr:hypothetical protein [Gammaproteobacteria bacterium]